MAKTQTKSLVNPDSNVVVPAGYREFFNEIKEKIRSAQLKAAIAASRELIQLYWDLGKDIAEKQEKEGWGSKVLERVAKDLQNELPGVEGFSRANIFRMRAFYLDYSNCLTAVRQLHDDPLVPFFNMPWGHNFVLLDKLKSFEERLWKKLKLNCLQVHQTILQSGPLLKSPYSMSKDSRAIGSAECGKYEYAVYPDYETGHESLIFYFWEARTTRSERA